MKPQIAQQILGLAEYYDKTLSESQLGMFVEDLESITLEQLQFAIRKYRTNPKNVFFPMPSALLGIVMEEDGRPGIEEAWAMIPKDEGGSVVWTDEMREAFGAASNLLSEDPIAARMTLKEKYGNLLAQSRHLKKPVKWVPSFGHDRQGRETALREAIDKNRITIGLAQRIMPEFELKKKQLHITNNADTKAIQQMITGALK